MPRSRVPSSLHLSIPSGRGSASYRLVDELVRAIASGAVQDGDPLPSTRSLALGTGLARSVVVSAYEELAAAGYVRTKPGSMTRVELGAHATARSAVGTPAPGDQAVTSGHDDEPTRPAGYDLLPGSPDATVVNARAWTGVWRAAQRSALTDDPPGPEHPQHGHGGSHAVLRRQLAAHLRRHRAIVCEPEDIFLFPSVPAVLTAVAEALGRASQVAAVEDPSHVRARQSLAAAGYRLRPAAVDHQGLSPACLEGDEAIVYVSPNHQYPLGARMPGHRRRQLVEWAGRTDTLLVEDDYGGEFRGGGAPAPSLRSLDSGEQHVVHMGGAHRIVHPEFRVAWAVVPPRLREPMREYLAERDTGVSTFLADAFAAFIDNGSLTRHIARSNKIYSSRRAAFHRACAQNLPGNRALAEDAGLHVALELDGRLDDLDVADDLRRHGLLCLPLTPFYSPHSTSARPPGLVCGFNRLPEARAAEATQLIADVLRRYVP